MGKGSLLIHTCPEIWKRENPGKIALVQSESGHQLMYHQFSNLVDTVAYRLLDMGVSQGDRVAVLLPPCIEGIVLFFACAKVGAIYVPFDLQLPKREFIRRIQFVHPKAFFFVGHSYEGDYSIVGKTVRMMCPLIPNFIQINLYKDIHDEVIPGAVSWYQVMRAPRPFNIHTSIIRSGRIHKISKNIHSSTPLLMFFNGKDAKPILLCHENINVQIDLIRQRASVNQETKMLVNQMLSEMGNFIHSICATLSMGGTIVLAESFDPLRTHQVIEDYCITHLNQSVSNYESLWDEVPPTTSYHSSLHFAIYQTETPQQLFESNFLSQMKSFVPSFGSGIFIPEAGGFIGFNNFSRHSRNPEHIDIFPDLIPLSIREPLKPDQSAGDKLPDSYEGNVYIHPPSVFLGYYKTPKSTSKTITREGFLHTQLKGYISNRDNHLRIVSDTIPDNNPISVSTYSPLIY